MYWVWSEIGGLQKWTKRCLIATGPRAIEANDLFLAVLVTELPRCTVRDFPLQSDETPQVNLERLFRLMGGSKFRNPLS